MTGATRLSSIVLFLAIAILLNWAWVAIAFLWLSWPFDPLTALPGFASPLIAAVIVSARDRELSRYLRSLLRVRVAANPLSALGWWALALLGPMALCVIAAGFLPGLPRAIHLEPLPQLLLMSLEAIVLGGVLLGELGWRAFLLVRLARSLPGWAAALLTALAELLWFAPLIASAAFGLQFGRSPVELVTYLAGAAGLSVLLSHLYLRAGRSVLLTALAAGVGTVAPALAAFAFVWVTEETVVAALAFGLPALALTVYGALRARSERLHPGAVPIADSPAA